MLSRSVAIASAWAASVFSRASSRLPAFSAAVRDILPAGVRFLIHGDEAQIAPEFARHPVLKERAELRHTATMVASDEKPATALRRGKGTSMWNAVEAVKTGEAAAAVSAGNTGAVMAISKLLLRMSVDIERRLAEHAKRVVQPILRISANVSPQVLRQLEQTIYNIVKEAAAAAGKNTTNKINPLREQMRKLLSKAIPLC